jgi:hypothetical protein
MAIRSIAHHHTKPIPDGETVEKRRFRKTVSGVKVDLARL